MTLGDAEVELLRRIVMLREIGIGLSLSAATALWWLNLVGDEGALEAIRPEKVLNLRSLLRPESGAGPASVSSHSL